ncbi:MAG TPA: hypothetical protein VF618_05860 [Thermoanaerobaculia bacterium]
MRTTIVALFLLSLAVVASAAPLVGREVLIPIAGRTVGFAGSIWRTELVITNLTFEYHSIPVAVEFVQGDDRQTFTVDIPARGTVRFPDFIRQQLGRDHALGMVFVRTSVAEGQLAAGAAITNEGPHGTFGQFVDGLPLTALSKQPSLTGLSVTENERTNVGVANPTAAPVRVAFVFDAAFVRGPFSVFVPAFSVVQIAAPPGARTAQVSSPEPVYAFASVIRNDTGDPTFRMPLERRPTRDFEVAPSCAAPATIVYYDGAFVAPGWIVQFRDGTDAVAMTAMLEAKYGFRAIHVYDSALLGFSAVLTPEQLAAIRCEAAVTRIDQNAMAFPVQ